MAAAFAANGPLAVRGGEARPGALARSRAWRTSSTSRRTCRRAASPPRTSTRAWPRPARSAPRDSAGSKGTVLPFAFSPHLDRGFDPRLGRKGKRQLRRRPLRHTRSRERLAGRVGVLPRHQHSHLRVGDLALLPHRGHRTLASRAAGDQRSPFRKRLSGPRVPSGPDIDPPLGA